MKKKILIIIPSLDVGGGAEKIAASLSNRLSEKFKKDLNESQGKSRKRKPIELEYSMGFRTIKTSMDKGILLICPRLYSSWIWQ